MLESPLDVVLYLKPVLLNNSTVFVECNVILFRIMNRYCKMRTYLFFIEYQFLSTLVLHIFEKAMFTPYLKNGDWYD